MGKKIICGVGRGCEDACPIRELGRTCPTLYEHALHATMLDRLRESLMVDDTERWEPGRIVPV